MPLRRRGGKVQRGRPGSASPRRAEVGRMTYYLLKPCRTVTTYISTLKQSKRVDLGAAAERLRRHGWLVSDVKVMLILEGDPELTVYESGKILVKTDDEGTARAAIDRVYEAIGISTPLAAA